MEPILRSIAVYTLLFVLFRIAGKRTLAQLGAFDVVLLLVIGEATQQALLGEDFSFTNAALVIGTLVGMDILLARFRQRWRPLERLLDEPPLVVVANGRALRERMAREGIDEGDVLHAARALHGLHRLDQIEYAVLEASGGISVIPRRGGCSDEPGRAT